MNVTKSIVSRIGQRRILATTGVAALALATAVTVGAFAPASAGQASPSLPDNPASDPALMSYIQTHDTPMGQTIRRAEQVKNGAVTPDVTQLPGLDVSGFQGNVNWASVKKHGAKFAYVKATESTNYRSPYFAQQYNGSYKQHIIRGAYHFAHPNGASGAAQANYFIAHGGGWSKDGRTLPGAVDFEANPAWRPGDPIAEECWNRSAGQLASWLHSFVNQYHAKEHVYPVIYTGVSFWRTCVGNAGAFGSTDPLWAASYGAAPGSLHNWGFYTFWQFNDHGTFPGDQDRFNGNMTRLTALAKG